ncbi:hypothetical protein D0S83_26210, partial [Klebsiella pneumoniae]|nr:hypothetical protein [Klebsiella pneumoniae]
VFAGKKSAQIREILISESAWEEMTCLFAPSLAQGTLIRVLQRYSQRLEGSFLYYPHRNVSPALRAVIDTLRM